MEYTAATISKIVKGKLIQQGNFSPIKYLLTDSRQLFSPDETIFFALESSRRSGINYVKELYEKGVRNFVVSKPPEENFSNANFILVKDTTLALQQLASAHRKNFS